MNLVILMLSLQAFLQSRLSNGGNAAPGIYLGNPPAAGSEAAETDAPQPYILIRPRKGHSDEEEATAKLVLEFGGGSGGY